MFRVPFLLLLLQVPLSFSALGADSALTEKGLATAEELAKSGADWAVRVDIDYPWDMSVSYLLTTRNSKTTIAAFRFIDRERLPSQLDLSQSVQTKKEWLQPSWLYDVKANGGAWLDGTTYSITVHDGKKGDSVWQMNIHHYKENEGLQRCVKLIKNLQTTSGLTTRRCANIAAGDTITFSLPLSEYFVEAATRFEKESGKKLGPIFASKWARKEGLTMAFSAEQKVLTGTLQQPWAIRFSEYINELNKFGSEHLYGLLVEISKPIKPSTEDPDPFADEDEQQGKKETPPKK